MLRSPLPPGHPWGNASPSTKDIKTTLDSVGTEADDNWLNKLVSKPSSKKAEDAIILGLSKVASVPAGAMA